MRRFLSNLLLTTLIVAGVSVWMGLLVICCMLIAWVSPIVAIIALVAWVILSATALMTLTNL